MREVFEFTLDASIKIASLGHHKELWPTSTDAEILEKTTINSLKAMCEL